MEISASKNGLFLFLIHFFKLALQAGIAKPKYLEDSIIFTGTYKEKHFRRGVEGEV
jgi:hypothetical protein